MANYLLKTSGLLGGAFEWSYSHKATSAASEATLNAAFSNAVQALWNDATNGLKQFCSSDVQVTLSEVITLGPTWHYLTGSEVTQAITGTDVNQSLPWSDAELITTRTALRRKNGHGRFFLPPFAQDQIAAHKIIPATVTKMEAAFATYFNSLATAGATLVVVNMKALKDGTPPFGVNNLIRFEVVDKPAHQRRRVSKLVPGRTGSVIP